jgi:uncharacterized phage-associated protein
MAFSGSGRRAATIPLLENQPQVARCQIKVAHADDVAAAIIESRPGLDQMQLHKLLYLVQAASLAWYGEVAFRGQIEAWKYGPMVRGIAGQYMQFGSGPIMEPVKGKPANLSDRERWVVQRVIERFGALSGPNLARLVKGRNSPWKEARGELPASAVSDAVITPKAMADFHMHYGLAPSSPQGAQAKKQAHAFVHDGDRMALQELIASVTGSKPSLI